MNNQHEFQAKSYMTFNESNCSIFYRTIKDVCLAHNGWMMFLNQVVDVTDPVQGDDELLEDFEVRQSG